MPPRVETSDPARRVVTPFAGVSTLAPALLPQAMTVQGSASVPWSVFPVTLRRASSAVVMLFIPGPTPDSQAEVVFTRRSTAVRSHKGQIGFPGGRAEPGDESPAATALRELEEELGVPRDLVEPVVALAPIAALDGSAVYPIVAVSSVAVAAMSPSADEVDEVFSAPWLALTPAAARQFSFNIFGNWRDSLLFPLPGRPIWGLTAKILGAAALG